MFRFLRTTSRGCGHGFSTTVGHTQAAIVGAGPAGSLLACYLKKRGFEVDVFECRSDGRKAGAVKGRSINLIMTSRGLDALAGVGLEEEIRSITVPVYGRVLHTQKGELSSQRYGPDNSYYNLSVSRSDLNLRLIDAAERAGVRVHFDCNISDIDVAGRSFQLEEPAKVGASLSSATAIQAHHMFGADGAGSPVRHAIARASSGLCEENIIPLGSSYKELTMPSVAGTYPISGDMLHIWPRGNHFMMALANLEGGFTMTLYMPDKGDVSFASVNTEAKVRAYFEEYYPDAIPLMPNFVEEYMANPVGFLGTLRCKPWTHGDNALILGDAAHAITPFFGQGCNCAFEDVRQLDRLMDSEGDKGMKAVFAAYDAQRKPNGDAIGNLALDNYTEMSARTADPHFLLQKQLELKLSEAFPLYSSRYAMVTHTLIPYATCVAVGEVQQAILDRLTDGVSHASQVDMDKAAKLVSTELEPLLQAHGVTLEQLRR